MSDVSHPVVNLVVDVQSGTDQAFVESVGRSVDALRAQGIPTIWITMSNQSRLSPPTEAWPSPSPTVRDAGQLEQLGFFEHPPSAEAASLQTYRDHMRAFGPKTDEAVFPKAFFGAFASREDLTRPELREHFTSQRRAEPIDIDNAFHGTSLQEYLRSLGTRHVTIMGGNADVCVTETSMGAATNGFRATILSDHVVSADPTDNKPAAQYKSPAGYERILSDLRQKITDRPHELAGNPTKAVYVSGDVLSPADKTMIRDNTDVRTLASFLSARVPIAGAALRVGVATEGMIAGASPAEVVHAIPVVGAAMSGDTHEAALEAAELTGIGYVPAQVGRLVNDLARPFGVENPAVAPSLPVAAVQTLVHVGQSIGNAVIERVEGKPEPILPDGDSCRRSSRPLNEQLASMPVASSAPTEGQTVRPGAPASKAAPRV